MYCDWAREGALKRNMKTHHMHNVLGMAIAKDAPCVFSGRALCPLTTGGLLSKQIRTSPETCNARKILQIPKPRSLRLLGHQDEDIEFDPGPALLVKELQGGVDEVIGWKDPGSFNWIEPLKE